MYSQIPTLGDGSFKSLPVIEDAGNWVGGSTTIAEYVEGKNVGTTLFPHDPQRLFVKFIEAWVDTDVHAKIFPLVALAAYDAFDPSQQEYFRITREQRLGTNLEAAREHGVASLPAIRATLEPARQVLKGRAFLAGSSPGYADYLLFGALKWQRLLTGDRLLYDEDPLEHWYRQVETVA